MAALDIKEASGYAADGRPSLSGSKQLTGNRSRMLLFLHATIRSTRRSNGPSQMKDKEISNAHKASVREPVVRGLWRH